MVARAYYVPRVIRLHSFFLCFYNSLHSHGIVTKHSCLDLTCSRPLLVFEMVKHAELSIRYIVNGNPRCPWGNILRIQEERRMWQFSHLRITYCVSLKKINQNVGVSGLVMQHLRNKVPPKKKLSLDTKD